uniref:Uncharacterized protein n=1 Tax=Anguilla anguilla TaxID=7936 RepID=A0A0E9W2Y2_ANGAN
MRAASFVFVFLAFKKKKKN